MHLLIMGAPGAGKGTCATELKKYYNIPHISSGDMFRQAISDKTEIGIIAKSFIDKGHLVPDEVTNALLKERLSQDDCKPGFILDGFPRTLIQAEELSIILKELGMNLDAVINLEIRNDCIIKRIVNRRICKDCGATYNLISLKPKVSGICDICGGELYTRADDTKETIQSRLKVYDTQTYPVIEYYNKLGLLVKVNSSGTVKHTISEIILQLKAKTN